MNEEVQVTKKKFHYAFWILIGCCCLQAGGLGAVLDSCGVFFVPVCEDLGFARAQISTYLTFYFIGNIIAMPIVGNVIEKVNINILLSVAFGLVCLALGLMSVYTEYWMWWISGAIYGLAGAFIFVIPAPIMITNWFHKNTGLFMGISMTFSGIGAAIFSPLFTMFIQVIGWRMAYVVVAIILACLVLPWTLFVFKLHPEDKGLEAYGHEKADEATAVIPITKKGVNHKTALKSAAFWVIFVMTGCIAFYSGFNSHLPGFAESIGYSAMFGATLLTAVSIGSIIDKLIMGWLNDRLGVRITFILQFALIAVGMLMFMFCTEKWQLYVAAILYGVQNSLVVVSTPLFVKTVFGSKHYAKIFSYVRVGTGVFGMFGPMVTGMIFDANGGFYYAFLIGFVIAIIGCILTPIAYHLGKRLVWEDSDDMPLVPAEAAEK